MEHDRVKDICYIGLFAAVICICSWISVPFVVPFTLQTFGVFLTLMVLGGKRGTLSIILYVLLGTLGLPVFASFNGGLAYILGPTGGFIVGFIFAGIIYWIFEKIFEIKRIHYIFLMLIGTLVIYIVGTLWFYIVYVSRGTSITFGKILMSCVVPFVLIDALKIYLVTVIGKRLTLVLYK